MGETYTLSNYKDQNRRVNFWVFSLIKYWPYYPLPSKGAEGKKEETYENWSWIKCTSLLSWEKTNIKNFTDNKLDLFHKYLDKKNNKIIQVI